MGLSAKPVYPLAVIEWKSFNSIGVRERVAAKRSEAEQDVKWLIAATAISPSMRGYAVMVDLRSATVKLSCRLVRAGSVEGEWEWGWPPPTTTSSPAAGG
jgi:hypothetical protein